MEQQPVVQEPPRLGRRCVRRGRRPGATAVAARVDEYNAAIVRVCAAAERCIDDGGAVFAYDFSADEISAIDFFHPSIAGQRAIAGIAWDSLEGGTT